MQLFLCISDFWKTHILFVVLKQVALSWKQEWRSNKKGNLKSDTFHFAPRIFHHIYLYQKNQPIFTVYFLPGVKIRVYKL